MQVIFIIVSAVTLISGIFVVTNRNLFHAALYMMLSFLGVAVLYGLLDMGFMAATQLLVYIGAISILVIFAIMMTRRLMQTTESPFNSQWQMGGLVSAGLFALVTIILLQVYALDPAAADQLGQLAPPADQVGETVDQLGIGFTSADQYVLPFELASVLLLVALVGAIIVARPDIHFEEEPVEAAEETESTASEGEEAVA